MLRQLPAAAKRKTRSGRTEGEAGGITRGHAGPSYNSAALRSASHPAVEDASSRQVSEERRREDGFIPGLSTAGAAWGLKELSHPGEWDKLTVVQRVLQITQESTHLGHSGLIFLSFDVSALSPAGLQYLIANVLNLVPVGEMQAPVFGTDLTDGAALLGLSDPWDPRLPWRDRRRPRCRKGIWGPLVSSYGAVRTVGGDGLIYVQLRGSPA